MRYSNGRMVMRGLAAIAGICVVGWGSASAQERSTPDHSPLEQALASIFSPQRAPERKTMGLLQYSFLDLVETSQPRLEVALVVDGTDSMGPNLDGVRRALLEMADDLELYKGQNVAFQLIVFRDSGSPSGEISYPLAAPERGFTEDRAALKGALEGLKTENGAPYFPEAVDLGVHKALSELKWTAGDDTSRWIFLFTDAPPFEPNFSEPETKARRHVDTQLIVDMAKQLGVKINCVLCTSRAEEVKSYEAVVEQTRNFMYSLASGSGGLMLDLSYPDIREALAKVNETRKVKCQPVGVITMDDVQAERRQAETQKLLWAETRRMNVAVLPHLPLEQMSFDARLKEVQIATEWRHKLKNVPGVTLKNPREVQNYFTLLQRQGMKGARLLESLAVGLDVDCVVWGGMKEENQVITLHSGLYAPNNRQPLVADQVSTGNQMTETQLVGNIMDRMIRKAESLKTLPTGFNMLASAARQGMPEGVITEVASRDTDRSRILEGMEHLESAVAFQAGSAEGFEFLEKADAALQQAVADDRENPLAQLLLANCHYNLAKYYESHGDAAAAAARARQYRSAMQQARTHMRKSKDPVVRDEIEGDFYLIIEKDKVPQAIEAYTRMAAADNDKTRLHSALRAHWMLAGIYRGDFGVDEKFIDKEKARHHLVKIMAHWQDSPEAQFVQRQLRWDPASGKTQFAHAPQTDQSIVAMVREEGN